MNIICFGQNNWDDTWTEKQQHMAALARRGHRVLYLDPVWKQHPSSAGEHLRGLAPIRTGAGLERPGPDVLYRYTYHYSPLLRWRLNQRRYPRMVRAVADKLHFPSPLLVAFYPSAEPLIDALDPQAIVYYAVDDYCEYGGMSKQDRRWTEGAEQRLLRKSQVAIGISPRLVERFRSVQPRAYLLENGVDPEHFSPTRLAGFPPHPAFADIGGPRIGFVGQIDERLDQRLLLRLAEERPDYQLVLIGRIKSGVDVSALAARTNVHFIDFVSYERLPGVLRELDVGLVPYHRTRLTNSCNPAKIFEYLAAGLPVVSTPLEGIGACRPAIDLAGDADAFIAAVDRAVADPTRGLETRLEIARSSAWHRRTDQLEEHLEQAVKASERPPEPSRRAISGKAIPGYPDPPEYLNDYKRRIPGEPLPSRLSRAVFRGTVGVGRLLYSARVASRWLRGQRPVRIRRILIARTGMFVGDLVAFLPTLAALRNRYPDAYIVLGVQRGMSAGNLLNGSGYLDEVRVLDFLSSDSRWTQLRGVLKLLMEGFDAVISGLGHFMSQEALLSGAPHRVGIYDGHPMQRLNSRVLPLDLTRHEADVNLDLVELLPGPSEPVPRTVPELSLDEEHAARAADAVQDELGIPRAAELVVVHTGAKKQSRRWPAVYFVELVSRLLRARSESWIVFSGVNAETSDIDAIRAALPAELQERALSCAGKTDLPALIGLLDRSAVVVSNDTGVMHIARARGAPLVALLGPENDRRWGPHPLGTGPAVALRYEVPCARCSRGTCEALFCLRSLSPEEVFDEVLAMLDSSSSTGGDSAAPVALVRRNRPLSWRALAERGFEVPLVSVILARYSPARGRPVPLGPKAIQGAYPSVERQDYPHIEVLVPVSGGRARPPDAASPRSDVTIRSISVEDGVDPLSELVAAARGDMVAFVDADQAWPTEKLSADVATLVREPGVDFAPMSAEPRIGGTLFRRGVLQKLLPEIFSVAAEPAPRPTPRFDPVLEPIG